MVFCEYNMVYISYGDKYMSKNTRCDVCGSPVGYHIYNKVEKNGKITRHKIKKCIVCLKEYSHKVDKDINLSS